MFLKERATGDLVEVLSLNDLVNPFNDSVAGRYHHGEEAQDPEKFAKRNLAFPSGEPLPRCWIDPQYRSSEAQR